MQNILKDIIENFEAEKFIKFFRDKSRQFSPSQENFSRYDNDDLKNGFKIGEINFSDSGSLLICAFEARKELTERAGKKAQYDKAKAILKSDENRKFSAGIFIFYDSPAPSVAWRAGERGNFRFSLVYDIPKANGRRDWNNYKRFTYFVSSDPQITNKTFKNQISACDFSSLDKIKEAFSVEKVTKDFYADIANWYFWAVENCKFPKDAEDEENGRNISIIRLITRMIFIWFMRERGLIPKKLFKEKDISEIINDLSSESASYYHAILQNLFFATLSAKKEDRDFRSEVRGYKGINPDRGNDNVYRYQKLFTDPEKLKEYFGEIPFLNGGLFECLDDRKNNYYIDGFTESKNENRPNVPNFLFFADEKKVDLNAAYGTKDKKYTARGLLEILSSFNFTIDENSPDDADVALDPELLGRVFENLLASFNPETSTTARKATGSYYTPREIVDYMVSESLKAYFKTHLQSDQVAGQLSGQGTRPTMVGRGPLTLPVYQKSLDEKLNLLFSTSNNENPFDKDASKKIVELIESVRIVDPAVGSGAFPMGALNKLVSILSKVDPGNELWKQAQISAADKIPDSRVREDAKERIEEFFKGKNADYGRKLYLIQKCIYGVDIQQIAVEIAKLRFFISLLVDEKIDKEKSNWGIEPLPNLDFKIMQGNSLLEEYEGIKLFDEKLLSKTTKEEIAAKISEIGNRINGTASRLLKFYEENPKWMRNRKIERPAELIELENNKKELEKEKAGFEEELKNFNSGKQNALGFYDEDSISLGEELEKLHKEFFEPQDRKNKERIKKKINELEWNLIEATLKEQNKISEIKKLEKFKKSNTKPFFLWKLNFAEVFQEKGGFDIVIGNPPYVSVKEISTKNKKIFSNVFETGQGRFNLFTLFLEKADQILKLQGIRIFILPEGLYSNVEYRYIRRHILKNSSILFIVLFSNRVFNAAVDTSIISTQKVKNKNNQFPVIRDLKDHLTIINQTSFDNFPANLFVINLDDESKNIIFKLLNAYGEKIESILEIQQGIIYSGQTKENVFSNSKINSNYKKILDGRDILKWKINWDEKKENRYICYSDKLHRAREERLFTAKEKLLFPRRSTIICGTYDDQQYYVLNTAYVCLPKMKSYSLKFILAILNSRLINYFYSKVFFGWQITIPALNSIAIPGKDNQNLFVEVVDKILALTKSPDYSENQEKLAEVKKYEKQIDEMVYSLYGLTEEERGMVEGE